MLPVYFLSGLNKMRGGAEPFVSAERSRLLSSLIRKRLTIAAEIIEQETITPPTPLKRCLDRAAR
jgi:hypothetical protein